MGSGCCSSADVKRTRKIQPMKITNGIGKLFLRKEQIKLIGKKKSDKAKKIWSDFMQADSVHNQQNLLQVDQEKLKGLIKSGPPAEYRWEAWKHMMEVDSIFNPEKYYQLLNEANEIEGSVTLRQIDVDVPRTFSWHPFFDTSNSSIGHDKLK